MEYYKRKNDSKVTCLLCDHYCDLGVGQAGICGVNVGKEDSVECVVYGYPNALHIDPIEKKPLYHFLPNTKTFSIGTVGCNFKCSFCQNWQLSQSREYQKEEYFSTQRIVELAKAYDCESISYTYNEPTIFFPYVYDTAVLGKKGGLKNVMVSNGYQSKETREAMAEVIDAVNIDLKSFDERYYKKNLGGKLETILDNLKFFAKSRVHLEITTLIVPTQNDGDEELEKMALFIKNELGTDIPWHLSAFHPDYKELELPRTPVETLLKGEEIAKKYGINNIHLGNVGHLLKDPS